jgi:hypothetical protein
MRTAWPIVGLFARCTVVGGLLASAPAAVAQWTSDVSVNTPVAVGDGDQGVPIALAMPGGRTWVVHSDNGAGAGIKYAIQQLDAQGVRAFAQSAVLSPGRTNTASFVIDADVNSAGEAFVAFDNNGIYVQKVLPDGTLPWASQSASGDGLFLTGSTGGLGPRISALADGSLIVCWGSGVTLNFRRINADGTLGATWTLTEAGRAQSPSDIVATGSGAEFIMLWVRAEGTNFVTSRKGLKVQKWDASNAQVWNAGVPLNLYTSGATPSKSIQNGYFPALQPDGRGGAVVAWYDVGAARNAWLQQVQSDGSFRFAADGLALSTTPSTTEFRSSASVAFLPGSIPADDAFFAAFGRSNTTQSQFGLGAQRVDGAGNLQWGGGAGLSIIDVSPASNQSSFVNATRAPGGTAVFSWLQFGGASGPMSVLAQRLGVDGAPAQGWSAAPLTVASLDTYKGRLGTVVASSGDWFVSAWAQTPALNGPNDVLAMRINAGGTLGTFTCGASDVAGTGQTIGADGDLSADDIIVFVNWFFASDARADIAGAGQTVGADGTWSADDLILFINRFFAGC